MDLWLSVCHKPVLYRNCWRDQDRFWQATPDSLHCVLKKFTYRLISKYLGYFPVELCPKLWTDKIWPRQVHRRRVRQTSDSPRSVVDNTWRWRTWPSAVKYQQSTVTCFSHSAPSFVYSVIKRDAARLLWSFGVSWDLLITARCTTVQRVVVLSHVVCLSACDVGGSWPHRLKIWKLIARTISPTYSLFVAQRSSTYSQGNTEKFWGDYEVGWEKVARWAQKWQYLWNALR